MGTYSNRHKTDGALARVVRLLAPFAGTSSHVTDLLVRVHTTPC